MQFYLRMCEIFTIFAAVFMRIYVHAHTGMRELVERAKRIVIFTHMAPDGDAMGSALALWHWVSKSEHEGSNELAKEVTVIVPNAFPAFFNWMPGVKQIKVYEREPELCNRLIAAADLFICTDFNDPKRIGPMGEKMMVNPAKKILIDHHLNPVDFADEVHSHTDVSSSCEIVYKILQNEGEHEIGTDIATCIYTGLMTDTGNFSYNSTNADLYDIIASLIRAGVKKDEIYNAVFNQYSTDRVRLTGYALYRKMRIYPEYHLALITLTADELDQFHYQNGDCEGLVNMPLQIADVYYSVLMREERAKPGTPKSRIRISLRSQGDRPVNIWASEVFHGGGHMNASGGDLLGSIPYAIKVFEESYKKYITK